MQISRVLFNRMCSAFGLNTAMLGVLDPALMRLQPVNAEFTPGLDRVLADVPAQGAPLAPVSIPVASGLAPLELTDTLTSERVIEFATDGLPYAFLGGVGAYPFTIYGTRLVSQDLATLLATEKLATPTPISAQFQGVEVPRISFRFPTTMVR